MCLYLGDVPISDRLVEGLSVRKHAEHVRHLAKHKSQRLRSACSLAVLICLGESSSVCLYLGDVPVSDRLVEGLSVNKHAVHIRHLAKHEVGGEWF